MHKPEQQHTNTSLENPLLKLSNSCSSTNGKCNNGKPDTPTPVAKKILKTGIPPTRILLMG